MPMNSMGVTNQDWGVCGFTSSFYAMYAMQPNKRPQLNGASQSHRVLAEIKTYLNILKAEGEQLLLNSIRDFTRSFGGNFANFSIDDYITRINNSVNLSESDIKKDELFGIAMPPDAVVDYLKRIWEVDTQAQDVHGGNAGNGDGILGVTSQDPNMPLYHGLEHYLYRKGGRIYSWGDQYSSVQEAGVKGMNIHNWTVCYFIAV